MKKAHRHFNVVLRPDALEAAGLHVTNMAKMAMPCGTGFQLVRRQQADAYNVAYYKMLHVGQNPFTRIT